MPSAQKVGNCVVTVDFNGNLGKVNEDNIRNRGNFGLIMNKKEVFITYLESESYMNT